MTATPRPPTAGPRRLVVFACGNADRGDDAVAAKAVEQLHEEASDEVEVMITDAIEPDDLVRLPTDARVVIVDAVSGVSPGTIVVSGLQDLDRLGPVVQGTSTHQLPLPQVIGLASILRGVPLEGRFVGIGIELVEPGRDLSPSVLEALPALRRAIEAAADGLVGTSV